MAAEGLATLRPHALVLARVVNGIRIEVGESDVFAFTGDGDASTERIEDSGATDEVVWCADEPAEDHVHAVVEGARGVVEVPAMLTAGEVGAAVEVHVRAGSRRGGRVLGEVRVITDGEREPEAFEGEGGAVSARRENGTLAVVQVLLVVGGERVASRAQDHVAEEAASVPLDRGVDDGGDAAVVDGVLKASSPGGIGELGQWSREGAVVITRDGRLREEHEVGSSRRCLLDQVRDARDVSVDGIRNGLHLNGGDAAGHWISLAVEG